MFFERLLDSRANTPLRLLILPPAEISSRLKLAEISKFLTKTQNKQTNKKEKAQT